jgi:hypothetical protein
LIGLVHDRRILGRPLWPTDPYAACRGQADRNLVTSEEFDYPTYRISINSDMCRELFSVKAMEVDSTTFALKHHEIGRNVMLARDRNYLRLLQ